MNINIDSKLNSLVQISKLKLEKILKRIPGTKNLIIESDLIRPLERICGVKWLRMYGVDKIFKLEDKSSISSTTLNVFFISSNLIVFKNVLNQIQNATTKNCHIIVTPRIFTTFNILLEELGLYDIVILHQFRWELINIDANVFSFEIPQFFREIFIDNDLSLLPTIAHSLHTLFKVVGQPNITITIGEHSQNILKQLNIIDETFKCKQTPNNDFDCFVLMDRSVDFISALLTPTTYSSLLNEIFQINCGVVENKGLTVETNKTYLFLTNDSDDLVYSDIKNRHISEVSDILSNYARQLKHESVSSKEMALSEIKTYVQTKLQKVSTKSRYLSCHLHICEQIIEKFGSKFERLKTIEQSMIDNINRSSNVKSLEDILLLENECISLKLICLMSLTQNLTLEEYNNLKLQYLHKVGYKYLYIFDNLVNCGLIIEPIKTKLPSLRLKKDFYYISNKLKLIPTNSSELNMRTPTCPSYVFGGYFIPIISQLITILSKAQTENDVKSKLELINGILHLNNISKPFPLQRKKFLVGFVGGVTYSEIAALNLVEKLYNCKIIVVCNSILSGNTLINSVR